MKSTESEKAVQQAIIASIKREFIKASWWDEVQEDVKTRLNYLVDNVDKIGALFTYSFMSVFSWEFERRRLEGNKTVTSPSAAYFSTLMGMRISEEAYQCGLLPTRAMLDLYDFVQPNDADVAACLMFCYKVEMLQKSGMLEVDDMELKTSPSEMAKVLQTKKRKTKPPIQEEVIEWEDPTDPTDPIDPIDPSNN